MKKLIVVAIIVMMITACSVAAYAYAGTVLNVTAVTDGGSYMAQMGWYTDRGDGAPSVNAVDISDVGTDAAIPDGVMQTYINPLAGLSGVNIGDFRAPDVQSGLITNYQTVTKIWRVNVWMPANAQHVAANFGIKAWFNPGFGPGNADFFVFAGVPTLANLKLMCAQGGPGGWLAKLGSGGAVYNGASTWTLPAPTSSSYDDPDTGEPVTVWGAPPVSQFTVYAQGKVPEPGSILALFSGLVGLVGYGIRRRK